MDDEGTEQVLREFDDGYVGPSGWEWAQEDGCTQYWGYEDSGQYDADNDTLLFRRTVSESSSARRSVTRMLADSVGWSGRRKVSGSGAQVTVGHVVADKDEVGYSVWENGAEIARWRDCEDEQAWLLRAGVVAGLRWALSDEVYVGASGGYEWVERHSFNAGPDRVRLDMSGWRANLAIGYLFGGGS